MNLDTLNKIKAQAELLHDEQTISQAINRLAEKLTADYQDKRPILLVVLNGGLVFAGKLLPKLNFPAQIDYCHATRYRGETHGGEIHWRAEPHLDLTDRHVVLIDDILDEGYTLQAIIEHCLELKVASIKSVALIEKLHDRKVIKDMRPDYCELTAPDRYVFGCGMDYHHYWRNCEEILIVNADH